MDTLLPVPVAPAIKQVRHFGQIHHHWMAGHVAAQSNGQFAFMIYKIRWSA